MAGDSVKFGSLGQTNFESLEKETLKVNPFPNILNEEEFRQAQREGENFLENYNKEQDKDVQYMLDRDYAMSATMTRQIQSAFNIKYLAGKISEDFSDTIMVEDPVFTSEQKRKIATLEKSFAQIKTTTNAFDETVEDFALDLIYEVDPSGKGIVMSIAGEKVRKAKKKLGRENNSDIIGLDTGVFIEEQGLPIVISRKNEAHDVEVQPTHRWLQKPKSKEEMTEMLRTIRGRKISIVTGIAIYYQVLQQGHGMTHFDKVETEVEIRALSDQEITDFVEINWEVGQQISGGVDFTTFGREIVVGTPPEYDQAIVPEKYLKKLWAQTQIIKRAAQLAAVSK